MRTTLELDDQLLAEARDIARRQGETIGHVVSDLLRTALKQRSAGGEVRNGVPLFTPMAAAAAVGSRRPDLVLVNSLRDDE